MAANRDALYCGVCFHSYSASSKDAKHPRLLPCSHTICWSCHHNIGTGSVAVACPFCRKKFPTKSSQENTYIIAHLREKRELEKLTKELQAKADNEKLQKHGLAHQMRQEKESWEEKEKQRQEERRKEKEQQEKIKEREERDKLDDCNEHGREENLFCKDLECQKPICSLCLSRNHLKHEVVDLQEVQEWKRQECLRKDTILEYDAVVLQEKLEAEYKRNVSQVQQHVNNVKSARERVMKEIARTFDHHCEEILKNGAEYKDLFTQRQSSLEAVSENVKSRTSRIQSYTGSFYKELLDEQTAHEMANKSFHRLEEEKRIFTFQRYRESANFGEADLERMCGALVAETIEEKEEETEVVDDDEENSEESEENDDTDEVEVNEDDTSFVEAREDVSFSEDEANDQKNATDVDGDTDDANDDSDEAMEQDQTEKERDDEPNKENDNPDDVHRAADGVENSCTERERNIHPDARVLGIMNTAVLEHLQMLANNKRPLSLSADEKASTSCSPSKRTKTS